MKLVITSHSFPRLFLIRITIALLSILILICYTTLPIYAQNSAEEYFNSGVKKADAGDYEGAIEDYNKAIKINPKLSEAYHNKGVAKAYLGDYRGALKDFDKAIEINPMFAEAYYNRGVAKIGLGQKYSGCLDLSKAGELGFDKAYELIKEFCNP